MSSGVSRRGLFSLFGRALRASSQPAQAVQVNADSVNSSAPVQPAQETVAVIQGRFCLAYTSVCSVCVERCPVPGAIQVENGLPMIVSETCTGCGVCHEVCPAPKNAILVLPRHRISRFASPPPPGAA